MSGHSTTSGYSTTITAVSLLGRLATGKAQASDWVGFVDRYGPFILAWCRTHGCPTSELEDALQEVLIKLLRAFPRFHYEPNQRFRSWLATVTQHVLSDMLSSRQYRTRLACHHTFWSKLDGLEAREDLNDRIASAFDLELFEQACAIVQRRIQPQMWQTFALTRAGERSPEEAARELGISRASLYVTRSRVVTQIKAELEKLHEMLDGGPT